MQQAGRDTGSMGGGVGARLTTTAAGGASGLASGGASGLTTAAGGASGLAGGARRVLRPNGRRAAGRFQAACTRLAWSGPKHGTNWALDEIAEVPASTLEAEAARALVEMAVAGDGDNLRRLLRPDPACEAASWSVACYRIGDLVPHTLRDFTDPIEALATLTDCGDADHLAAELVASTAGGLCWVVVVRTGEQVRFQILDEKSVLDRPGRHSRSEGEQGALRRARAHWAEVVASWHARQGPPGRIPEAGAGSSALGIRALSWEDDAAGGPDLLGAASGIGAPSLVAARIGAAGIGAPAIGVAPWAEESFAEVVDTLNELVGTVAGIASVVERLERSLSAVATRLDALSPSQPGVRPLPRVPAAHVAVPDAAEPFHEPGHHWWTPKHRDVRRRPAVDGAPVEPL